MNHERFKIFREKLNYLTISDYHGLNSPGLTCYLNSVLQVLFMTKGFREEIQRLSSKDTTTIDPYLKRLFAALERGMARTHNITEALDITDLYEQRDAAEYFENILRLTSPEASKMFKGELIHKNRCLQCEHGNVSRSKFWILPLVVENSRHQTYSVEQGFKAFFKGEKVCEDNVMFCNHCKEKQEAEIDCEITHSPEILTLLLKRFSFDHKWKCYVKLHCKVDVPQTLHVKSCTYDLYALVNHFGNLTGGHYTADIKSFETGEWYHFNDDIVKMVKQPLFGPGNKSIKSCTAYLLMYRKGNTTFEKADEDNQETQCAHLDVEAEERHVETKSQEDLVAHRQLVGEGCNRGNSFKQVNGDSLEESPDGRVWNRQKNFSGELVQQLKLTHQRPHKEMLPQTDSKADGDKDTNLQTDERHDEPNRQQLGTNFNDVMHLNTEDWGTQPVDRLFEKRLNLQERLKPDDISWKSPENTHSYTRRSHSPGRMNEPTELNSSSSGCRKAGSLTRNNIMQNPVTAHSSKQEFTKGKKTADVRNSMKQEPWR